MELDYKINFQLLSPSDKGGAPSGSRFMPNVVQAEIVQDHRVPVRILELTRDISGHVMVNLSKVLS